MAFCALVMSLSWHHAARAQDSFWTPSIGPFIGTVNSMCSSSDGTLFAGTYQDGIFRSSNSGAGWEKINTGWNISTVSDVRIVGDVVLVGAWSESHVGIFRSTDRGVSWTRPISLWNIYCMYTYGDTVFAGSDYGIHFSYNRGLTWSLAAIPSNVYSIIRVSRDTLIVGTLHGLYYSHNGGASWTASTSSQFTYISALRRDHDGIVYANWTYGVCQSTDNGVTWAGSSSGALITQLSELEPDHSGGFFASTSNGIYHTTDKGLTWSLVASTDSINTPIRSFHITNSGDIFVGTYQKGIYKSHDEGNSFNQCGLPLTTIHDILLLPDGTLLAATGAEGIMRTTDGGATWSPPWVSYPEVNVATLTRADDGTLYGGAASGWIYRSTDRGESWTTHHVGTDVQTIITNRSGHVFAGTWQGLFRSTDRGMTWTRVNGIANNIGWKSIRRDDGTLFVATGNGAIRSTDDGDTWQLSGDQAEGWAVGSLSLDSLGRVLAGVSRWGEHRLLVSDNNGLSWTQFTESFPGGTMAVNKGGHIFVASAHSVERLKNRFGAWGDLSSGLPKEASPRPLAIDQKGFLYAGLVRGGIVKSMQTTLQCFLDPTVITAGVVRIEESSIHTVRLRNLSAVPLNMMSHTNEPTLLVSPSGVYLPPHDSVDLQVNFSPVSDDTVSAWIVLDSDANTSPDSIHFTGSGKLRRKLALEYNAIIFSPLAVDQSLTGSLPLSNTGFDTLHIHGITISSPSVVVHPQSGAIPPDGVLPLEITFQPKTTGLHFAEIVIESDAPTASDTVWVAGLCNIDGNAELISLDIGEPAIEQNYPNPFNSQTTFRFSVPEVSHASIEIYDLTGRLIDTPLDKTLGAGVFEIRWNFDSLSSGIYVYRYRNGNRTQIRKMILLR